MALVGEGGEEGESHSREAVSLLVSSHWVALASSVALGAGVTAGPVGLHPAAVGGVRLGDSQTAPPGSVGETARVCGA